MGLVQAPGKPPRAIYDASFQLLPSSLPYNFIASKHNEPEIVFMRAKPLHLIRIYNLRITYPDQDILLMDDDVVSAFRIPKYNPFVICSKAFCAGSHLHVCVGQTFGDCTSPSNFEPLARARMALAEHFSATSAEVPAYDNYLDLVEFTPPPGPDVTFIPAIRDEFNPGVLDPTGAQLPTQFVMHVDDCLYAEVGQPRMKQAMRHSIHSLHEVADTNMSDVTQASLRPPLVDVDKFRRAPIGPTRYQLGDLIDTREMLVFYPDEKRKSFLSYLKSHWGRHRRSYTILNGAEFLGRAIDMCRLIPAGIFLFVELHHELHRSLRANHARLRQTDPVFQNLVAEYHASTMRADSKPCRRWFRSKMAKELWQSKARTFISSDLRSAIDFFIQILSTPARYRLAAPIAHLILTARTYPGWGDACPIGGGGFSLLLKYWWSLEWARSIVERTLLYLPAGDPLVVSNNMLEYVAIILGVAGAILAWEDLPTPKPIYPTFLQYTDNTTALSWTTKRIAGMKTPQARALSKIFCHLLLTTFGFGVHAEHIAGDDNDTADFLSRLREKLGPHSLLDFSAIVQKYPSLRTCRRFLPSPELLSLLSSVLLTGCVLIPTTRVPLGQLKAEPITI
jgi:hypothetical protein